MENKIQKDLLQYNLQTKIEKCLCVETAGALLRPTWPALILDFNCECLLTEFSHRADFILPTIRLLITLSFQPQLPQM